VIRHLIPSTPEARGRLVGALLGLAGAAYITERVLSYLQIL
jgi:hypothetical protein